MKRPFVVLAIALIIGILLSFYFDIDLFIISIILFCVLILSIFCSVRRGRLDLITIVILFFILGIFIYNANDNSILKLEVNNQVKCKGTIVEVLNRDSSQERYIVSVGELDNREIKREKLLLKVIGDSGLEIGDNIEFVGKLRLPMINTNPKLFNYRLNLMTERIFTTMVIREDSILDVDGENLNFRHKIKREFITAIEELFDEYLKDKNSSLIKSIILGRAVYLEDEDISLYRNMGLAHILAVSGLHIGIISVFFMFIFSHLGIKKRKNVIFTLLILWTYGYLIGFPPSILRANIMLSLLIYSQLIHKPYDSINILSFAIFLLLLINPYYLFNIGFQLSFLASLVILVLSPRIEHIFYPYKNYITRSLSAILGVQIGIFPIQVYYFNRISIMGILANMIIIPILSISLVLGFLMIIFRFVFGYMNSFVGPIVDFVLSLQFSILKKLDMVNFNIVKFPSPELVTIILFYIMLAIIFKIIDIRKLKNPIIKMSIVYFSLLIVYSICIFTFKNNSEIHFIDVGQGDAILIRTKGRDYLMDTGGSIFGDFDIGKNITLPYLEKLGIRRLDAVFITHFDEDHCQGLEAIIDNIPIDMVLSSYIPAESRVYEKIIEDSIPFTVLKEGDCLNLSKKMKIRIIWPFNDIGGNYSPNDSSLVSLLSIGRHGILFTGDIEREAESLIANRFNMKVDILKVPHHGSNTSSTEMFLKRTRPRVGIISAGRDNIYGHPSEEVLNKYDDFKTRLYRTDDMGLIKVIFNENDYEVQTFLKDRDRTKPSLHIFIYDNIFMIMFYLVYYMLIYIMLKITSNWEGNQFELW